jgi:hypothetical protein
VNFRDNSEHKKKLYELAKNTLSKILMRAVSAPEKLSPQEQRLIFDIYKFSVVDKAPGLDELFSEAALESAGVNTQAIEEAIRASKEFCNDDGDTSEEWGR